MMGTSDHIMQGHQYFTYCCHFLSSLGQNDTALVGSDFCSHEKKKGLMEGSLLSEAFASSLSCVVLAGD